MTVAAQLRVAIALLLAALLAILLAAFYVPAQLQRSASSTYFSFALRCRSRASRPPSRRSSGHVTRYGSSGTTWRRTRPIPTSRG